MGQMISGFELQEDKSITDLESWPPFAEWFTNEYGFPPHPRDRHHKATFEAFMAGGYWEAQRGREEKG